MAVIVNLDSPDHQAFHRRDLRHGADALGLGIHVGQRHHRGRAQGRLRAVRPGSAGRPDRRRRSAVHGARRRDRGAGRALCDARDLSQREFAVAGGLMSVGPTSLTEQYRLAGTYAGKILGRRACGFACPAADQVRTGDQSKDRKGARPRRAANVACPRRRGDRIKRWNFRRRVAFFWRDNVDAGGWDGAADGPVCRSIVQFAQRNHDHGPAGGVESPASGRALCVRPNLQPRTKCLRVVAPREFAPCLLDQFADMPIATSGTMCARAARLHAPILAPT